MQRLVEIRSYKLKPGTLAAYHEVVTTQAIPLLRSFGADVVAFGPSAHEDDTYYLIRAYTDLNDLNAQQKQFYSSAAWRDGPREGVTSRIESYLGSVFWLSAASVEDLRHSNLTPGQIAPPGTNTV